MDLREIGRECIGERMGRLEKRGESWMVLVLTLLMLFLPLMRIVPIPPRSAAAVGIRISTIKLTGRASSKDVIPGKY